MLVVGVVAGTVNTMVGGGTSIVIPLLFMLGLPAQVANGTNRVAVCFQGLAAVGSLRRQGVGTWRETLPPALLAFAGGVPGAWLASVMDPDRFRSVVGWILLVGIAFFFMKPAPGSEGESEPNRRGVLGWIAAFGLGVYGGFLGAGVGVLILIFLTPCLRLDLVRMVAVKVLMVFLLSLSAGAVFIWEGHVRWSYALPLIVANGIGGVLGARLAVAGGDRWIRRVVAVVAAGLAALLIVGFEFRS